MLLNQYCPFLRDYYFLGEIQNFLAILWLFGDHFPQML